jgi:8-oxo-dGTP pyrophosphatase MutT (NUDIX family)
MAIPHYIQKLREKVGHDLLFVPGVCGIVFNDAGEVLLNRRSDTGRWAVIGGVPEPGEELADALIREVFEETGIIAEPQRISGVDLTPLVTCSNGDLVQYVVTTFVCRAVGGELRVDGDESLEVNFFPLNAMPVLSEQHRARIDHAVNKTAPYFKPPMAR